ncbi:unnamed protein product [Closterium sp. NIES-65]|nr:unnamed protein product [Closterium sp. NIES-65]
MEERKRVRATMAHLQREVAALKQAWMGDPSCARLKGLLDERESQLEGYQLVRQERLHMMAGMKEEVSGEVASPFLSAKIEARKERTQISQLDVGGQQAADNKGILGAASQYYRNLFGTDRRQTETAWFLADGKKLSQAPVIDVSADWTEKEVKRAFRSMAKNKAPEKDGLLQELFEDAITILLHKKGGRDQLEKYQSITLLSFTYKVRARVVADKMKSVLHEVISSEQYGFLPSRRLSDAVGLVTDVIEAAKNKDEDWYLLLVDVRKAFDLVSRDFLFSVLERMGFPSRFIVWLRDLHKDTRTSLLINRWMGEAVEVVSGVRLNCPLAPYLFLCVVEPLAQEAANRKLGLTRGDQRLAYMGYADGTTLFLQGEVQIEKAEKLLEDFEEESGLATNKEKSSILPLGRNLDKQSDRTDGFKWVKSNEAERLLEVSPSPVDVWERILKLTHDFMSGNRATTDKGFILWSRELLYMAREDEGVGVCDMEIALTFLTATRIGLLLTETNVLKRDIMLQAGDLPLGTDPS